MMYLPFSIITSSEPTQDADVCSFVEASHEGKHLAFLSQIQWTWKTKNNKTKNQVNCLF
jgi:hypothetical protein